MSALAGGGPIRITAEKLIGGFRAGLHPGKVSHHLVTNYRISIEWDRAEVWAHGYSCNQVAALGRGADLWENWGNYRLSCRRIAGSWRLDGFRYNDAVRTHMEQGSR